MRNTSVSSALFLILIMLTGFAMPALSADKFPKHPLDGLWRVVDTQPSLEGVDPRRFDNQTLFPGQVIRFIYEGPWGDAEPQRDEYKVILYPPFPENFCLHETWRPFCDDGSKGKQAIPPAKPIDYDARVDSIRTKLSDSKYELITELATIGLKPRGYYFELMLSDGAAMWQFVFKNWNTVSFISNVYKEAQSPRASYATTSVIQTLKRIEK